MPLGQEPDWFRAKYEVYDWADFGFHNADNMDKVRKTAHWLEAYHILPRGGGWEDNDQTLLADAERFIALKNEIFRRLGGDKGDGRPRDLLDMIAAAPAVRTFG